MVRKEDISLDDIDYTELEKKYSFELDESVDHIMVIDGLPKVDESKEKKVVAILKKILFDKVGAFLRDDGTFFLKDPETQLSTGCAFFEFDDADQMKAALAITDGHVLDKNHTLMAYPFSDIDKLVGFTEEKLWDADERVCIQDMAQSTRPFTKEWLLDQSFRDQLLISHMDQLSLWWNEKSQPAELIFRQKQVSDSFQWSSQGTFLASMHPQGLIVWDVTQEDFTQYRRISHPQVSHIHFSPQDRYVATFSHASGAPKDNLAIWHIATGMKIWSCDFIVPENVSPSSLWPVISWSFDDAFFAFAKENGLYIYRTASSDPPVLVTGKGPLRQEGIANIMFVPTAHHWLAYWCPETLNTPAKVSVISVPSLDVVRSKNLFNVAGVKLCWHHRGDALAILLEKWKGKTKKTRLNSTLEIFHMTVKDIPVDMIDLEGTCDTLAWEPNGHLLALLEHSLEEPAKTHVKFLEVTAKQPIKLFEKIERKNVNRLIWNPKGKFIILAGLDSASLGGTGSSLSTSGHLEFWGLNESANMECMHIGEHYMATHIEWDPSGRYLLSYQSILRYQMESSYMIWDFHGQVLHRVNIEKLKWMKWRPRPLTLLTVPQQKEVMKKLKEYSVGFDQQDLKRIEEWMKQGKASKLQMKEDWDTWRRLARLQWGLALDESASHAGLHSSSQSASQDVNDVEDWVEEIIEQTEEIVVQ